MVIDAGIRVEEVPTDGESSEKTRHVVLGDVDWRTLLPRCSYITPVPGGGQLYSQSKSWYRVQLGQLRLSITRPFRSSQMVNLHASHFSRTTMRGKLWSSSFNAHCRRMPRESGS